MGGSSFDLIAQELQKQNHIMEKLKAENISLRQQLMDLRAGQGIFLEIDGTRMALDIQESTGPGANSDAPRQSLPANIEQGPDTSTAEARQTKPITPVEAKTAPLSVERKEAKQPTFLEEIMLDEFQSALTSPQATLQDPEKKPKESAEEQKAALRRELMGSFLLE